VELRVAGSADEQEAETTGVTPLRRVTDRPGA
jgi:hypothetical protein